VEKIDFIHTILRVYYYYHFCIQVISYNNKRTARKIAGLEKRWRKNMTAIDGDSARDIDHQAHRTPTTGWLLWTNGCISTGADVQNQSFWQRPDFCPTFMQAESKLCPARKRRRKPLMLWSKPLLSTANAAFTYYYQLCIHIFCLHKQSGNSGENPANRLLSNALPAKKLPTCNCTRDRMHAPTSTKPDKKCV